MIFCAVYVWSEKNMIKRMEFFLKIISLFDVLVAFCSLFISCVILKQPVNFSVLFIVIFTTIYSILIWMTGKRIGSILSENQVKLGKKIVIILAVTILMNILQNLCTITYIFSFFKNISIIIPCMFSMIVFQLVDGMKRLIENM